MKRFLSALFACLLLFSACPLARAEESVALPIIMYHHVLRDSARSGDYVVTPDTLEGDLKYLSERGYKTVSARSLVDWCEGNGTLPDKPVMLTFDDGQESFMSYVLPLLRKYDMCAVCAVVGSYADTYTETEDHNIAYSYLTWSEIEALSLTGLVEIASHTQNMHSVAGARKGCSIMPGEDKNAYFEALSADLGTVESSIQKHTGDRPLVFAYPFGLYCPEAREIVSGRCYRVALTCDEKINRLTGDERELLNLGRFNRSAAYDRGEFFGKMGVE